jgi:hypothetical protein
VRNFSTIRPGEPYDAAELVTYLRRLNSSGYFASAQAAIDPETPHPDDATVKVAVIEAPTRRVEGGVGYSTDTQFRANASWRDVDLDGEGLQMLAEGRLETKLQSASVRFTQPPNDHGWIGTYSVGAERTDIEGLVTRTAAIGTRWHTIEERNERALSATFYLDQQEPSGAPSTSAHALYAEYERYWRRADDLIAPAAGWMASVQAGGGIPGASTRGFGRVLANFSAWYPVGANYELQFRAQGGAVLAPTRSGIPSVLLFRTGSHAARLRVQSLGVPDATRRCRADTTRCSTPKPRAGWQRVGHRGVRRRRQRDRQPRLRAPRARLRPGLARAHAARTLPRRRRLWAGRAQGASRFLVRAHVLEPGMGDAHDDSKAAGEPRARRWRWLWRGIVVAAFAAFAAAAVGGYALLTSQAGVDWLARELVARSGGAIEIEGATGSLLDSVRVRRLVWHGTAAKVTANDAALTWRPSALWSRNVAVESLSARELFVEIAPSGGASPPPADLALPFEVAIDRVAVDSLEWRAGTNRGRIDGLAFGYAGGASGHRVSGVVLSTAMGRLAGDAGIAADAPFAIDVRLTLSGNAALNDARIEIAASGSLSALTVDADGSAGDGRFAARAAFAPLAAVPLVDLVIDARDVDLARWDRNRPATRIAATVRARPVDDGLGGTFDASNGLAGALDTDRIPVERLAGRFSWRADAIALDDLAAELVGGGRAAGRGRFPLGADGSAGTWSLDVRDLDLSRLHAQLTASRLGGRIDVDLGAARTTMRGHLADRSRVGGIDLEIAMALQDRVIEVERLRARARGGELAARGRLALDGGRAFSVDATAAKLRPVAFRRLSSGSIDGTIALRRAATGMASRRSGDRAFEPVGRSGLVGTARGTAETSLHDAAIDLRAGRARPAATEASAGRDRFSAGARRPEPVGVSRRWRRRPCRTRRPARCA